MCPHVTRVRWACENYTENEKIRYYQRSGSYTGSTHGEASWQSELGKTGNNPVSVTPSAFEQTVRRLKLSPHEYVESAALRDWVLKNKDSKYVPQDLLKAWGFGVRSDIDG